MRDEPFRPITEADFPASGPRPSPEALELLNRARAESHRRVRAEMAAFDRRMAESTAEYERDPAGWLRRRRAEVVAEMKDFAELLEKEGLYVTKGGRVRRKRGTASASPKAGKRTKSRTRPCSSSDESHPRVISHITRIERIAKGGESSGSTSAK